MPPTDKVDHGDHRSRGVGVIGHATVPEAHVADDYAPSGDVGLEGLDFGSASRLVFGRDLDVFIVVRARGIEVGAGPDFGASIFRGHVDYRDIGDDGEGGGSRFETGPQLAVVEVQRLLSLVRQTGVTAVHCVFHPFAQRGPRDLYDEVIYEDIAEEIGWKRWRILLQVAVVELKGDVVECEDGSDIGEHTFAQKLDVFQRDGVVQQEEAVFPQRVKGQLQMFRNKAAAVSFVLADVQF